MSKVEKNLDLLIIGSGPAGLTAGLYAARLKLDTLILEDELVGGQIKDAYIVENYPGFNSISGSDLIDKIQEQVISAGAKLDEYDNVISVKLTDEEKIIETKKYIYKPKAVIIASGSKRKELPIEEEKKFHSRGIHYCELCDGSLYENKHIAVVGGGSSALLAASLLANYGSKITIIHRRDSFRADKKIQDEIFNNKKIEIIWNTKVISAIGEDKLKGLTIQNVNTKENSNLEVDGVFVYIGLLPRTEIFKDFIKVDNLGNIISNENCETNVKGVFAAGDVRVKAVRQLTTAVSDGTIAALMAEKYISNLGR